MDAYTIFEDVRNNINETVATHWTDLEILNNINNVQAQFVRKLSMTRGNWFVNSFVPTGEASVDLPSDFTKLISVVDTISKYPVPVLNFTDSRKGVINFRSCTLYGNKLEFSPDSLNTTVYYQKKIPKLHLGLAGSGSGVGLLEFSSNNRPINQADYYVGEVLIVDNSLLTTTITTYNGTTRIATIPGTITVAENDPYGTVSLLPEEALDAFVYKVTLTCLAKPSASIDTKYFQFYRELYRDASKTFESWISSRNAGHNYIGRANGQPSY